MNERKTNRIGIAVVEHQRQFLIGVRDASSTLAGYHEFPGGKCEPGEASDICAARECREETGLDVQPLKELLYIEHAYEHADVLLHFWLCAPIQPAPDRDAQNLQGFCWIPASELSGLKFPEANAPLIDLLIDTYVGS
ncbi:8-oxo-dGTP diphosphatase [Gimesia panareensis]|uniref:8-oxo-dGTP diphosphatase n=1 Tax=Gimesia panareensis TaxID=2527978 RepID=A0A517QE23_9PLAN|nr:NUDIX domain-containing protein [Gimesia panareensis]QDT29854.1 8-oxo-dGTP diphosphatase [Gimesia panareensis]